MNKKKTMQLLSIPYLKSIYFSQQDKQRDLKMQKKEAGTTGTSKDSSTGSGKSLLECGRLVHVFATSPLIMQH